MKTILDTKNALLKRRELKIVVESASNPGFPNAQKMVAEQFKSADDVIVIKTLKSKFGRNTFLIDALIYDSVKDKERIEPRKKVKKAAGQEQAAGAK